MLEPKIVIDTIAYHLPHEVVETNDIENELKPFYQATNLAQGQIEMLTGVKQRRWWPPGFKVSDGALEAAKTALERSQITASDLDTLVYAGVCRDYSEPATACRIGYELGVSDNTELFDISNACLGVINGIVTLSEKIRLGKAKIGMVIACESSRSINEDTLVSILQHKNTDHFRKTLANFTGGSGAIAVIVRSSDFICKHRPFGMIDSNTQRNAAVHHGLCRWGYQGLGGGLYEQFLHTEPTLVLKHGVELGIKTWLAFKEESGWNSKTTDRTICHQVGKAHRHAILSSLDLNPDNDYVTYPWLGNIGSVSLPITAAIAHENGFIRPGQRVGFLGIGSGLNCMILGVTCES